MSVLIANVYAIEYTSPLLISYPSDQIQLQSYNVSGKTWRMGTYIGDSGPNRNFTIWEYDLHNAMTIMQASGNVGIGTVDPKAKLEVKGPQGIRTTDGANGIITLLGDDNGARIITGKNQGGNRDLRFYDRDFYTGVEAELMRINSDGKVGIGTASVEALLDVAGTSLVKNRSVSGYSSFRIQGKGFANGLEMDFFGGSGYDNANGAYGAGYGGGALMNVNNAPLVLGTGNTARVHIAANGNVGIGTVPNSGYKLDVSGSANFSGAITVASVNTKVWSIAPDYVFEKDYKLSALDHVEKYVDEHKHLPEIPSAKEIREKGLDLAEMNMKLLKKVEELTLYAIQQEKKDRRRDAEVAELKQTISLIKARR